MLSDGSADHVESVGLPSGSIKRQSGGNQAAIKQSLACRMEVLTMLSRLASHETQDKIWTTANSLLASVSKLTSPLPRVKSEP